MAIVESVVNNQIQQVKGREEEGDAVLEESLKRLRERREEDTDRVGKKVLIRSKEDIEAILEGIRHDRAQQHIGREDGIKSFHQQFRKRLLEEDMEEERESERFLTKRYKEEDRSQPVGLPPVNSAQPDAPVTTMPSSTGVPSAPAPKTAPSTPPKPSKAVVTALTDTRAEPDMSSKEHKGVNLGSHLKAGASTPSVHSHLNSLLLQDARGEALRFFDIYEEIIHLSKDADEKAERDLIVQIVDDNIGIPERDLFICLLPIQKDGVKTLYVLFKHQIDYELFKQDYYHNICRCQVLTHPHMVSIHKTNVCSHPLPASSTPSQPASQPLPPLQAPPAPTPVHDQAPAPQVAPQADPAAAANASPLQGITSDGSHTAGFGGFGAAAAPAMTASFGNNHWTPIGQNRDQQYTQQDAFNGSNATPPTSHGIHSAAGFGGFGAAAAAPAMNASFGNDHWAPIGQNRDQQYTQQQVGPQQPNPAMDVSGPPATQAAPQPLPSTHAPTVQSQVHVQVPAPQAVPPPTPATQATLAVPPASNQAPSPALNVHVQLEMQTERGAARAALSKFGQPDSPSQLNKMIIELPEAGHIEAARVRISKCLRRLEVTEDNVHLCQLPPKMGGVMRLFIALRESTDLQLFAIDYKADDQDTSNAPNNTSAAATFANNYPSSSNAGATLQAPGFGLSRAASSAYTPGVPSYNVTQTTGGNMPSTLTPTMAYGPSANTAAGVPNFTGSGTMFSNSASGMAPQQNNGGYQQLNNFASASQAPTASLFPTRFGGGNQQGQQYAQQVVSNSTSVMPQNNGSHAGGFNLFANTSQAPLLPPLPQSSFVNNVGVNQNAQATQSNKRGRVVSK